MWDWVTSGGESRKNRTRSDRFDYRFSRYRDDSSGDDEWDLTPYDRRSNKRPSRIKGLALIRKARRIFRTLGPYSSLFIVSVFLLSLLAYPRIANMAQKAALGFLAPSASTNVTSFGPMYPERAPRSDAGTNQFRRGSMSDGLQNNPEVAREESVGLESKARGTSETANLDSTGDSASGSSGNSDTNGPAKQSDTDSNSGGGDKTADVAAGQVTADRSPGSQDAQEGDVEGKQGDAKTSEGEDPNGKAVEGRERNGKLAHSAEGNSAEGNGSDTRTSDADTSDSRTSESTGSENAGSANDETQTERGSQGSDGRESRDTSSAGGNGDYPRAAKKSQKVTDVDLLDPEEGGDDPEIIVPGRASRDSKKRSAVSGNGKKSKSRVAKRKKSRSKRRRDVEEDEEEDEEIELPPRRRKKYQQSVSDSDDDDADEDSDRHETSHRSRRKRASTYEDSDQDYDQDASAPERRSRRKNRATEKQSDDDTDMSVSERFVDDWDETSGSSAGRDEDMTESLSYKSARNAQRQGSEREVDVDEENVGSYNKVAMGKSGGRRARTRREGSRSALDG